MKFSTFEVVINTRLEGIFKAIKSRFMAPALAVRKVVWFSAVVFKAKGMVKL